MNSYSFVKPFDLVRLKNELKAADVVVVGVVCKCAPGSMTEFVAGTIQYEGEQKDALIQSVIDKHVVQPGDSAR
jgi:hypothetical protein